MNDFKIIRAESYDAATICDLHKLAWEEAFSKDYPYPPKIDAQNKWETLIRDGNITVHLAVSGESRFGFLAYAVRNNILEITDLFVRPINRGNGIGKALILAVINSCNIPIQLWVAETNSSAIHLYTSIGFSTTTAKKQELRNVDKANLIEMYRKGSV